MDIQEILNDVWLHVITADDAREMIDAEDCADVKKAYELLYAENRNLRNEIARLNGQTNFMCDCCGGVVPNALDNRRAD